MELFCTTLFTMSLAAAIAALGVMVVHFFLYKAPRALVCLLWLVVLFRMACPVSLSLPVSLVPQGVADGSAAQFVLTSSRPSPLEIPPVEVPETTPTESAPAATEEATDFTPPDTTNETAPAPTQEDGTPWAILFAVWLAGTIVGLVWGLVSYLRLRRRVAEAVLVEDNVYESDQIPSPFVLGIFRPKIYLTPALSPQEKRYVLLHERAHIRRGDCIVKPLAYLLLCSHWFNPVLWVAYRLLCLDLETACDQAVLRRLPKEAPEETAGYAQALLHLSREPGVPAALPLAFGEEDAKARIALLLSYKRPAAGVLATALVLCLLAGTVFAVNPEADGVRVDWHRVTQGAMICQGEEVPLPESLVQPLAALLEDTKRSAYVSCDDPGLPEGTILLSHPDDSSVSYRLFPPCLVQVRQQGEETTFRQAVLNGKYSDYHTIDGNTVYLRWISWYRAAEALTGDPSAQEVYALAPKGAEDLEGAKALLDALGVQELVGPYTIQLQAEYDGRQTLVLLPDQTPEVDGRLQQDLAQRCLLLLALVPELDQAGWVFPDTGVGLRVDRASLPRDGLSTCTLDEFSYLYSQRHLGWWNCLSLPYYVCCSSAYAGMFQPAYDVEQVLYQSEDFSLHRLDAPYVSLSETAGEFLFSPQFATLWGPPDLDQDLRTYLRAWRSEALTDRDPVPAGHPADALLPEEAVQEAWYLYRPYDPDTLEDGLAEYADHSLWSEADTGYRLYETQDALYLAFWDWDNTHPWHLAWLVKLAPKVASSNDDVYFYPGMDRDDLVNLYEWEGDLHG